MTQPNDLPPLPVPKMDCSGAWIVDEAAWKTYMNHELEKLRDRCAAIAQSYQAEHGGWIARRIAQNINDLQVHQ